MSVCRLYQSRAVLLTMALQYYGASSFMLLHSSLVSLVFACECQSCFSNSVKKRSDTESANTVVSGHLTVSSPRREHGISFCLEYLL